MARDSSGGLHAVYADVVPAGAGPNYTCTIYYTRSLDNGATWASPHVLTTRTGGAYAYYPVVETRGTTVYIAYVELSPLTAQRSPVMHISTNDQGTSILADAETIINVRERLAAGGITIGALDEFQTDLKVDGAGRIHLAWTEFSNIPPGSGAQARKVRYACSPVVPTDPWTEYKDNFLTDATYYGMTPCLSYNPNSGEMYLAYGFLNRALVPIREDHFTILRRTAANTWVTVANVAEPYRAQHAKIIHDAAGGMHLVYIAQADGVSPMAVNYRRYNAAGVLQEIQAAIVTGSEVYNPQIGLTAGTNIPVIQFTQNTGLDFYIRQVSRMSATQWSLPTTISSIGSVYNHLCAQIINDQPDALWFNKNTNTVYFNHVQDLVAPWQPNSPTVVWSVDGGVNSADTQGVQATAVLPARADHATPIEYDWTVARGPAVTDTAWTANLVDAKANVGDRQTVSCLVRARDAAGNMSVWSTSGTVAIGDRTPPAPTGNVVWVDHGVNTTDNQGVRIDALADGDATQWQYRIDSNIGTRYYNGVWGAVDPTIAGGWTVGMATTEITPITDLQTAQGWIRGRDAANNYSAWVPLANGVIGDRTPPSINIAAPLPLTQYNSTAQLPIRINFTATDVGGGVSYNELWYVVSATGVTYNSGLRVAGTSGQFTFNPAIGSTTYNFYLKSFDQLGNFSTTTNAHWTAYVSATALLLPSLNIIVPATLGEEVSSNLLIQWRDTVFSPGLTINFYVDNDANSANSYVRVISLNVSADDETDALIWPITGLTSGQTYRVYGVIGNASITADAYSVGSFIYQNHGGVPGTTDEPTFYFTDPDGIADTATYGFMLQWIDADADSNANIFLYYDTDTNAGNGRTAINTYPVKEDPDGVSDRYWWDTVGLASGLYYVCADISDGVTTRTVYSYNPVQVISTATHPVSSFWVEPDGIDDLASSNFTLSWVDANPSGVTYNLYYTTEPNTTNGGVLIVAGIAAANGANSYLWNCSALASGFYFVYAASANGSVTENIFDLNPVHINHGGLPNDPPVIRVLDPDGLGDTVAPGAAYSIFWETRDPDSPAATVQLYYDTDASGLNGVRIDAGGLTVGAGGVATYTWTVPAAGTYYVYAILNDGTFQRWDYSAGPITIDSARYFHFTEPDGIDDRASNNMTISWTDAYAGDAAATIELWYDNDRDVSNGLLGRVTNNATGTAASDILVRDNVNGLIWDCRTVPNGTYYVYARVSGNPVVLQVYSEYPVIINHAGFAPDPSMNPPSIVVIEPDGTNDTPINNQYSIYYQTASLAGDGSRVALYYDTDTNANNGMTLITSNIPAVNGPLTAYQWNMSTIASGAYYIYAVISNNAYVRSDYSSGPLGVQLTVAESGSGTGEKVYSYPNPFRPGHDEELTIAYEYPANEWTRVYVYNMLGQRVWQTDNYAYADKVNAVHWDGRDAYRQIIGNGVYLILLLDDNNKVKYKGRMIVLD